MTGGTVGLERARGLRLPWLALLAAICVWYVGSLLNQSEERVLFRTQLTVSSTPPPSPETYMKTHMIGFQLQTHACSGMFLLYSSCAHADSNW